MARKAKIVYTGREVWVNQATDEIREVYVFERPVGCEDDFMITYLAEIINMIEPLGPKKMIVVKYILQNMCKANNTLITTNRKLAAECGVACQTVAETLKLLKNAGIITRTTGAIMMSPKFSNNWNASKEASMMIK